MKRFYKVKQSLMLFFAPSIFLIIGVTIFFQNIPILRDFQSLLATKYTLTLMVELNNKFIARKLRNSYFLKKWQRRQKITRKNVYFLRCFKTSYDQLATFALALLLGLDLNQYRPTLAGMGLVFVSLKCVRCLD